MLNTALVRPFNICVRANYSLLPQGESGSASLDISGASKLRDVTFRINSSRVEWVTVALQTITPKSRDLRQISIYLPCYLTAVGTDVRKRFGDQVVGEWLDLDRLLVRFWESHSIRPIFARPDGEEWEEGDCIGSLLPETTRRGIVDLVC